jgi:hypothetical protein
LSQAGIVSTSNLGPIILTFQYTNVVFPTTYTALATDEYLSVNTSGGSGTIVLPASPTPNRVYIIKDRTGNSSINNITVQSTGGTTVDLAASYLIAGNFGSIMLLYNSGNYEIF